jgi:uncharacterized protein
MIIDAHCHAGRGDGFTGPWNTHAPLAAYLRRASSAGITHTVLFGAFHSDYARVNEEVGGIVARGRGRFFGFAFVNAVRDKGRIQDLVAAGVQRFGFCGIKVHRSDAPISREICEVARRFRLPVLYDVLGAVSTIDLFAPEYPDVPFVIPHLSSFGDDFAAQRAFIDVLCRLPNVHTDTSGVRRFDLLDEAVRRAGPHKVLFGSDGPWLHPGVELAKVRALALDARAESQVLAGTFLRLTAAARAARRQAFPSRFASSIWSARSLTFSSRAAC